MTTDYLEGLVTGLFGGVLLTLLFAYVGIPASDALSRHLVRLHRRS